MNTEQPKNRTGKSQFIPIMQEVRARLAMGETNRQIHNDLVNRELVKISYDQFSRYIRQHIKADAVAVTKSTAPTLSPRLPSQLPESEPVQHPFRFAGIATGNGDRRRNSDKEFHNPVPDRKKIYGTTSSAEE